MSGRRIFIGDVQGCLDPLVRLLDELSLDPRQDRVWFTGDLVNKGEDNAGVLRLARSISARSVLGNHDVLLLELAAGRARAESHTLGDVLSASDRDELVTWLFAQPVLVVFPDIVLVHAAIRPGWDDLDTQAVRLRERFDRFWAAGRSPFEDEDIRFALTARYCDASGRQAAIDHPPPGPPFSNWADFYRGERTVVFGHFARQGLVVRPRLRGLDTGCVYGGRLSAWIAEEDRVVSVPARR